jgi:predicted component of type VI protein secretion system
MSDDSPVLRIHSAVIGEGERVLVLGAGPYTIGRGKDCDVVLLEQAVSRQHARIERDDTGYVVIDLDSATGLYVDGERVARRRLHDGQTIKIGDSTLQYVAAAQSQPTLAAGYAPTEIAATPSGPLFSNVSPPKGYEGADTWVGSDSLPSSRPTEMGTEIPTASSGTEAAPHVPAPAPKPIVTPAAAADTDPAAPAPGERPVPPSVPVAAAPAVDERPVPPTVPVAAPVVSAEPVSSRNAPTVLPMHAPPPPQALGSQPPPHDAPMIPPMDPGVSELHMGPVVRGGPSIYELGDAARVGNAQSSSLDLRQDVGLADERPSSSLGGSGMSVGAYIGIFVVGLLIAFGVAVALYGIP